jgi:adenylosuccinate synthase
MIVGGFQDGRRRMRTSCKRRCGRFDARLLRQTITTSSNNGIALTKLHVWESETEERDRLKLSGLRDGCHG